MAEHTREEQLAIDRCNTWKIIVMLIFTTIRCVAELTCGYAYGSVTLVADSFHMFSDAISFVVSLIAVTKKNASTDTKPRKTFGYLRSEPLGAMVHGSLLVGLAFSVGTQAILEIIEPEPVENAQICLIVGACGMLVDIAGLALFWQSDMQDANMNIRSLFLEKIGDFAGTSVVIISCALSYVYELDSADWKDDENSWVVYVDPAGTLIFCCILLFAAKTIYKMVVRILMQDAPSKFPMVKLLADIGQLKNSDGQQLVRLTQHHIWQIDNDILVMTVTVENLIEHQDAKQDHLVKSRVISLLEDYGSQEIGGQIFSENMITVQVDPKGGFRGGKINQAFTEKIDIV